jgi:hypothetical protein
MPHDAAILGVVPVGSFRISPYSANEEARFASLAACQHHIRQAAAIGHKQTFNKSFYRPIRIYVHSRIDAVFQSAHKE